MARRARRKRKAEKEKALNEKTNKSITDFFFGMSMPWTMTL